MSVLLNRAAAKTEEETAVEGKRPSLFSVISVSVEGCRRQRAEQKRTMIMTENLK
jgi:hypothetical protein